MWSSARGSARFRTAKRHQGVGPGSASSSRSSSFRTSTSRRVPLAQIRERDALVDSVHGALVFLVGLDRDEAVARHAVLAEEVAVGEAAQRRSAARAAPSRRATLLDRRGRERCRSATTQGGKCSITSNSIAVVVDHRAQLGDEGVGILAGQEPAVELGARVRRDDVRLVARPAARSSRCVLRTSAASRGVAAGTRAAARGRVIVARRWAKRSARLALVVELAPTPSK